MGRRHRPHPGAREVELSVIATPLLRHRVVQHAFVVPDLDAGIEHWRSTLGAGPFVVMRDFVGNELTYRGAPSATPVDYAFGQSGEIKRVCEGLFCRRTFRDRCQIQQRERNSFVSHNGSLCYRLIF